MESHPASQDRKLVIQPEQWNQMLNHILSCLPEEGCGILGGREGRVGLVVPVTNILRSPARFRMAPEEQLRAFRQIEEGGMEMVAFYHSHPSGPAVPSQTDLAEFAYPGVLSIIWSPGREGWQARAFLLDDQCVVEVDMVIEDQA